ncbi:MAG: Threonine efflux protein [Desulfovibrio sp.]
MPDFIPSTFGALALAHFLALLSPGPDFFLVVGHAVRHRLRGTIFICTGIALGNAGYIAIAIAGWSAIKHSPFIYRSLEVAGGVYLFWMGCMLLRASRHATAFSFENASSLSPAKQLCMGLGSALLNPKNAVFYLALMTVIIGADATLAQQVFSGIWMALLVFLWDVGLAAAIAHPKAQRTLEKKIPLIEGVAGVFLILLAVSFVIARKYTD